MNIMTKLILPLLTGALLLSVPLSGVAGGGQSENQQFIQKLKEVMDIDLETGLVTFKGVNVQIVDGTNSTGCEGEFLNGSESENFEDPCTGLGNLIIGYNEPRSTDFPDPGPELDLDNDRLGSHNLIVGREHSYTSYGGILFGKRNIITGDQASISGGVNNLLTGSRASISAGFEGLAEGRLSSIGGGDSNTATGITSAVSGGKGNSATGDASTVGGGLNRDAPTTFDWAAGSLLEGS